MADTFYISASANRFNHSASISSKSVIAFASGKQIALWDPSQATGVYKTLPGHKGLVTSVHFLSEDVLLSGDTEGEIRVWSIGDSICLHTAIHAKSISCISSIGTCIITGASDSTLKIWIWDEKTCSLSSTQSIHMNGRYPLTLALSFLPKSKSGALILAVGATDRNIQLYTRSPEGKFTHTTTLAGHEDWVRAVDFCSESKDGGSIILASGSQDGTIRLWNVEEVVKKQKAPIRESGVGKDQDDLLDAFEASLGELADDEGGRQISLKKHILNVSDMQYSITFDALLIGHEAGITSLSWRLPSSPSNKLTLMSTSTDSSLILWTPSTIHTASSDEDTSIWINTHRFGDVGGQRLGGFLGSLWSTTPTNTEVVAWGWAGGFRRWRSNNSITTEEDERWAEVEAITGHHGAVKDISWSPNGEYLISVGIDQTTRIHAPISSSSSSSLPATWHEISRPQIHGYDLLSASFLDQLRFVSIADEKVVRVFEAPQGFVRTITALGVVEKGLNLDGGMRPESANVPPLGLSNKASAVADHTVDFSTNTTTRPFEGDLSASTLWPETEKLFGHGYELISLAVSSNRRFVATACKATTAQHAVVRIYDSHSTTWGLYGQVLEGHTLTVTRIAFSPDDRLVLTVSRDRTWRLFENSEEGGRGYTPVAFDKSHARIIWDCAWDPSGEMFVTASRDKTVRIWSRDYKQQQGPWTTVQALKQKEAATAVACASNNRLVVGLEIGEIVLYSYRGGQSSEWHFEELCSFPLIHVDHIYRLAWRPGHENELATCSEDGTIKLILLHPSIHRIMQ